MATAKITLIGFYRWMKLNNDDLFANLSVPAGIDKNKLINTILMNGAEFEVLYGDADYFKFLIGTWSDKWYRTIDRWYKALAVNYNPLENYDRMEEWNDNTVRTSADSRTSSDSRTGSNTRNESGTDTTTTNANSTSTGSGSNEDKKSAYDSATYVPFEKAETSSSGSNTSTGIESKTDSRNEINAASETGSKTESGDSFDTSENLRTGRAHGNIGVTTSQQMLESEIDISRFNLYDEIAALFLTEFCVYTY